LKFATFLAVEGIYLKIPINKGDPITGWKPMPLSLYVLVDITTCIFPPALKKRPDPLRTKGKMGIDY
jgi:hypothetical protein